MAVDCDFSKCLDERSTRLAPATARYHFRDVGDMGWLCFLDFCRPFYHVPNAQNFQGFKRCRLLGSASQRLFARASEFTPRTRTGAPGGGKSL